MEAVIPAPFLFITQAQEWIRKKPILLTRLFGPTTAPYLPSTVKVFNLDGSTGREAFVWVDYILFDGADAVIATKLRERGMKVSIEAVEWFKRKIINSGDLNIKAEEIEMWMRQQQDEFTQMMRDAERQGRVRKKKKQVSAYGLDMLDALNTDFEDKEIQEFMQDYLPKSRPPTPKKKCLSDNERVDIHHSPNLTMTKYLNNELSFRRWPSSGSKTPLLGNLMSNLSDILDMRTKK